MTRPQVSLSDSSKDVGDGPEAKTSAGKPVPGFHCRKSRTWKRGVQVLGGGAGSFMGPGQKLGLRPGLWMGLPSSTSDQQCDLPLCLTSVFPCKQDGWLRGADEITRMTVWHTACSLSPGPLHTHL